MKELVGHGSKNKHIPEVSYNAPIDFIKGILSGYFSGDGTIEMVEYLEFRFKRFIRRNIFLML